MGILCIGDVKQKEQESKFCMHVCSLCDHFM